MLSLFVSKYEDGGSQVLLRRNSDSNLLKLYIQFICSRAFQRMGLLHRLDLDWEQKRAERRWRRTGSEIEEA